MISCLLERRQHQYAILHFRDPESCDTQDFALSTRVRTHRRNNPFPTYLVGHDVPKQHDMSWINTHTVALHRKLNFIDDRPSCSFDSQYLRRLDDVVRGRLFTHNPCDIG